MLFDFFFFSSDVIVRLILNYTKMMEKAFSCYDRQKVDYIWTKIHIQK